MRLTSGFVLVDVLKGRKELAKHFEVGGPSIPVTITGYIDGTWGHDDGTSQEFQMVVETIAFGLTSGLTPADEEDRP